MTENLDEFVPLFPDSDSTDYNRRPNVTVLCPPCDACETQYHDGLTEVTLGKQTYEVCEGCLDLLVDDIERYHWWDRLSEAHYNQAAEFLRSLDEVWCVHDNAYAGGEMWVHTPYCDAAVVNDVCDHFGFRIRWFSIVEPGEHEFDCIHDHGPCVEINLEYNNRVKGPFSLKDNLFNHDYHDAEYVKDHTKLFGRDN